MIAENISENIFEKKNHEGKKNNEFVVDSK